MAIITYCIDLALILMVSSNSSAVSVEPKYTKFMYEEQLLEKMVRLEVFVENMEKEMKKFISDSPVIGSELQNSTTLELKKVATQLDMFKTEMEAFQTNVTLSLENMQQKIDQQIPIATVVFSAYSTVSVEQEFSSTDPVIFEHVALNEGSGYDESTGIFTAPIDGVYQFSAQLCANKAQDLEYVIMVNSESIHRGEWRAATDSDDLKCTSFSTVSIVRKGQNVSVRGYSASLDANSDDHHTFCGVLIQRL